VAEKQSSQGGLLYTTKGDNNTSPDPFPISYSKVAGRVVLIVPYIGYFVLSPLLDVALIAFLFVASLLGSSLKSPRPGIGLRRQS